RSSDSAVRSAWVMRGLRWASLPRPLVLTTAGLSILDIRHSKRGDPLIGKLAKLNLLSHQLLVDFANTCFRQACQERPVLGNREPRHMRGKKPADSGEVGLGAG